MNEQDAGNISLRRRTDISAQALCNIPRVILPAPWLFFRCVRCVAVLKETRLRDETFFCS